VTDEDPEEIDEGVSGIDEKVVVKVEVPVVGREDMIGEPGECGVIGESESLSRRAVGNGGGNSLPRAVLLKLV
jgi:hypothetical protein